MPRICAKCPTVLNRYHTGYLCYACQKKRLDKMTTDDEDLVDAEGYADMLGLDSAEQLKRLARDGKLARRVPVIREWKWRKEDIDTWFKQEQRKGDAFRRLAQGIASNLRRCRNDPVINLGPSDRIGNKVYGLGPVLGTSATGRGELVALVKVNRSVALNMLEQLPKKDFPELKDITDWGDLTYGRISEDLMVRLEAYF